MVKKGRYVKTVPKYRKPTIERITESLELDIRDMKIKTTWDFMKNFQKDMSYNQRIQYLTREFKLSSSAVEKIIIGDE